ncbi:hypothetical protein GDO78_011769 [Eleutherodactylus coqui]|uniref:Uncharacterized protein n=1 Tax=Eleutherodactylus coqui TaxID=57060 RepID=A0A8J6F3I5_ELECQ|nr:hypothetical protein GDO78_011769 [Eleutherodactylus coqui]
MLLFNCFYYSRQNKTFLNISSDLTSVPHLVLEFQKVCYSNAPAITIKLYIFQSVSGIKYKRTVKIFHTALKSKHPTMISRYV